MREVSNVKRLHCKKGLQRPKVGRLPRKASGFRGVRPEKRLLHAQSGTSALQLRAPGPFFSSVVKRHGRNVLRLLALQPDV